jgi:hypothetical protein
MAAKSKLGGERDGDGDGGERTQGKRTISTSFERSYLPLFSAPTVPLPFLLQPDLTPPRPSAGG